MVNKAYSWDSDTYKNVLKIKQNKYSEFSVGFILNDYWS